MDNSLKGLILAAGAVITCMVLSIGFLFARESQAISVTSADKLNRFSSELSESDFTMYDGLEVTGSDVVNFIKKQLGGYSSAETAPVCIYVKTSKTGNYYANGSVIESIQNFTHVNYISPLGKFTGKIVRDGNKVITGINFIQK